MENLLSNKRDNSNVMTSIKQNFIKTHDHYYTAADDIEIRFLRLLITNASFCKNYINMTLKSMSV